ncbi:MAG TPA: hypothetical protein VKC54_00965, partial [Patescibacteria group bacterium]|nr:hypothetical protein [Patescibacteria group bacterium]
KEIDGSHGSPDSSEEERFLDIIPYERVQGRTFKIGDKIKVIAVNKDFCETLTQALEENGFHVLATAPDSVIDATIANFNPVSDMSLVLEKASKILKYNLFSPGNYLENKYEDRTKYLGSNPRLFILVAIFFALFTIVIAIIYSKIKMP